MSPGNRAVDAVLAAHDEEYQKNRTRETRQQKLDRLTEEWSAALSSDEMRANSKEWHELFLDRNYDSRLPQHDSAYQLSKPSFFKRIACNVLTFLLRLLGSNP